MRKHIVISSLFAITLTACGPSAGTTNETDIDTDTTIISEYQEAIDESASTVVSRHYYPYRSKRRPGLPPSRL